jgi:hypothetical protein
MDSCTASATIAGTKEVVLLLDTSWWKRYCERLAGTVHP